MTAGKRSQYSVFSFQFSVKRKPELDPEKRSESWRADD